MDFRLKVFITVARSLSFTKASSELLISQPAISKHIQELEKSYGVRLFDRTGNKIILTTAGKSFLEYAIAITESYQHLHQKMNFFSGNCSGELHIGASTTIDQYILPQYLAKFISLYPDINVNVVSGNSDFIEKQLEAHIIEVGLVEGVSHRVGLSYGLMAKDELVVVCATDARFPEQMTIGELVTIPLVLRENGSGTLEVIRETLLKNKINMSSLNVLLQLGSTESIKSFVRNYTDACAIVSIHAVSEELMTGKLRVIDIDEIEFMRHLSYVTRTGDQNPVADRFIQLISQ